MFLLLAGVLVASTILYAFLINRIKGLPPGPPPFPFIGNLLSFERHPEKSLYSWRDKYGPVYTLWMPMPIVVIMGHKELQETMVQQADTFAGRPQNLGLDKLLFGGPHGLIFNSNEHYKGQRKFALHALRELGVGSAAMQDTIANCAREVVDRLKATSGEKVRLRPYFIYAVANVIWQLTFGRTLPFDDPLLETVDRDADKLMEYQGHPSMLLLELIGTTWAQRIDWMFGGVIAKMHTLNRMFLKVLDEETARVESKFDGTTELAPDSYVEAYLQEQNRIQAKEGDVGYFSRHQLVISAGDLWFAGFETTVTTLRYAVHYLINNQNVQAKMQAEIDSAIGNQEIRMEDQKKLPYCCAVIHEVQRCADFASIALMHHTLSEGHAGGFTIPAGVDILPQAHMVWKDAKELDRPDYFCPERFINEEGEFVKDARVSPFFLGRRSCLGEGLARMQLFIFLTTFVQHLTFSSPILIPKALDVRDGFIRSIRPYDVVVKGR